MKTLIVYVTESLVLGGVFTTLDKVFSKALGLEVG